MSKKIIIAILIVFLIALVIFIFHSYKQFMEKNSPRVDPISTTQDNSSYKKKEVDNFTKPDEEEFYADDILVINNNDTYRGIMFGDYANGSLIVGAGHIDDIVHQHGYTGALISTKTSLNINSGLYEKLFAKADFNGDQIVLIFKDNPRILKNDIIAFKGILSKELYSYQNELNQTISVPFIVNYYYESGNLNFTNINKFLIKEKNLSNDIEPINIKSDVKEVIQEQKESPINENIQQTEPKFVNYEQVQLIQPLDIFFKTSSQETLNGVFRVEMRNSRIYTNVVQSTGDSYIDQTISGIIEKNIQVKPLMENGQQVDFYTEVPVKMQPIEGGLASRFS